MKIFTLLLFFCFAFFNVSYSQSSYYWYKSNKIELSSDSTTFYFKTIEASTSAKAKISSTINLNETLLYQITDSEFVIKSTKRANKEFLHAQAKNLKYNAPMFKNSTGSVLSILPRIVVQVKNNYSIKDVLSLYSKTLKLFKAKGFNTYVLDCNVNSSNELLQISNSLNEKSGMVNWSEPEFYSNFKANTDPLYGNQYYLHNTGQYGGVTGIDINVEPAWSITKGSSTIRVAVIDEGVEDHEDFSGRVLSGFTAGNSSGIGSPQNGVKGHGVACAGIIAATQDNNIGIKGIAPNIRIVPINIFPNVVDPTFNQSGVATNQQIGEAIDWAWNQGQADVLSCSWGGGAQSNDIDAAIGRARTMGRTVNGVAKGCAVVFSSGNSIPNTDVEYPGNVNGVITVGACDKSGNIWSFSDRGPSMDLVAPSGDINLNGDVTTTDRMGANGYETGNYTTRFGGTSAACPQVSGVAALMLSVNPNLTELQVRSILQTTATDMGAAGFDNTFGFGRLNACAAISQTISSLPISGSDQICSSGTYTYSIPGLPSGTNVTWSVSPTNGVNITTSNNTATLTSTNSGTINLTATIPNTCGTSTIVKQINTGGPLDYYNVQQMDNTQQFCANSRGNWMTVEPQNISDITYFEWGYSVVNSSAPPVVVNSTGSYTQDFSFPSGGNYEIYARAGNSCGLGITRTYNVYVSDICGGGGYGGFSAYPNPAGNSMTITTSSASTSSADATTTSSTNSTSTSNNAKRPFNYKIYNKTGKVLKQGSSSGEDAVVDTRDLASDNYFLHVFIGKQEIQRQIIIKH